MDGTVLYEKKAAIALITINRPKVKNPLNIEVFRALDEILDRIAVDDDVRVTVVTGAGETFVAGADVNELLTFDSTTAWSSSRFQQSVFTKLERLGKPSIAAINGHALGGGLELALSCTLRVASTKARLGFPELGLGIIPAFGGTERLVRTVGHAKAVELILLGASIGGEEALKIGLVNRAVEPHFVLEEANTMAQALSLLSPLAVRLELELLCETDRSRLDGGFALESALGALAVSSPRAKALLQMFSSKRRDT